MNILVYKLVILVVAQKGCFVSGSLSLFGSGLSQSRRHVRFHCFLGTCIINLAYRCHLPNSKSNDFKRKKGFFLLFYTGQRIYSKSTSFIVLR